MEEKDKLHTEAQMNGNRFLLFNGEIKKTISNVFRIVKEKKESNNLKLSKLQKYLSKTIVN